jgi:hypothetical protein
MLARSRRLLIIGLFFLQLTFAHAAATPFTLQHPVQDKNFYLLSLIENDARVRAAIAADPAISGIAAKRQSAAAYAQSACKGDATCLLKPFLWTDEEIRAVSVALERLASTNPRARAMVATKLRPSHAYILFEGQSSGRLLAYAWQVCAGGLNEVISVYGLGLAPRYPLIDSMSTDAKSPKFQQQAASLATSDAAPSQSSSLFFEPSLQAALALLSLNHRDEAGRHEPMETGVNHSAVKLMASTPWRKYPYTVIIVPGAGPSKYDTPLSKQGRQRCALAAQALRNGKAPFILVSGGYVHPAQTHFSEAIEMKKTLIDEFHVPESAILVDPHARHTTTNMRNAAREIFRYNMPTDRPAIVVSDASQITYIAAKSLADRCLRELGYVPYRILRRDGDTNLVVMPLIESLEQDPLEPLDP